MRGLKSTFVPRLLVSFFLGAALLFPCLGASAEQEKPVGSGPHEAHEHGAEGAKHDARTMDLSVAPAADDAGRAASAGEGRTEGDEPARGHVVRGGSLEVPAGARVAEVVVFGGSATVGDDATVEGDIVVFGGSMSVGRDVSIVGDVVALGGSVSLGTGTTIGGDAVAIGGSIRVSEGGSVAGDAVTLGGSVNLEEGAVVRGSRVSIGAGRAIREAIDWRGLTDRRHRVVTGPGRYLHRVSVFLAAFAIGLIALSVMPRRMPRMSNTVASRLPACLLAGLLVFLAFVPLVVLLAITLIGILLIPLLVISYVLLVFVGLAAAALALGRILPNGNERSPILNLAAGMALFAALGIVALVPFIGFAPGLLLVAVTLVGVGGVVLSRFGQPEQPLRSASGEGGMDSGPPGPAVEGEPA